MIRKAHILTITALLPCLAAADSHSGPQLPDPLAAGWNGEKVCEQLHRDNDQRVLRCTFPPGVGHERHYHDKNFGYVVAGGRMRITDASGTREVELEAGNSYASDGLEWHEVMNIGDTTVVFLMFEPQDKKKLVAFATRYADAWSSQDPAAFVAFYAEDATFRINDGDVSTGRDEIEAIAGSFMTNFPDMVVMLDEVHREGDYVHFHWRWTGTNTGPGGTGAAVDLKGYEQWLLDDDGLIRETRGHMDDAEYQRQLSAGLD